MMAQFFIHEEIKQKLLWSGTCYLYEFPKTPKTFPPKSVGDECYNAEHTMKFEEIRYGKALMITRICRICGHADIEVFPPIENRMVSKD